MNKDLNWIDSLRTIATISVIVLHTSFPPVKLFGTIDLSSWWAGNFFDGGSRFCVPIFFMISGALLLSKDYSLSSFFKKRFFKIIPPFIFWSFAYIAFNIAVSYYQGESMSISEIAKFTCSQLYNGSSGHMWFIYTIIGLYLIVPIVRSCIKHTSNKTVVYFLLIWGVTLIFNWPYLKDYKPAIELMYFSGYMGYMVLGYYLFQSNNKFLNNKLTAVSMFIVGTITTLLATYLLSRRVNAFDTSMYVYLTPNVALSAMGVFLFFKNYEIKWVPIKKFTSIVSINSYGIYLIHILVLIIISKIGINWELISPAVGIITTSLTCFFISGIIIFMMKKIKFLNKLAG